MFNKIAYVESTPSESGLRLDAQATLSWLNYRNGKFKISL